MFTPLLAWCGEQGDRIGTILIVVGIVNAAMAIAQRTGMFIRHQHLSEMEIPVIAVSSLAVWFGIQLRRKNVSHLLRGLGLLCLLPVVTDAIWPDVCRMLFMALGILASLPMNLSGRPK